jgi:thioesterase domain-containing protein
MQLVSRIRAAFGVDLPVTEVFLRPDVRRLAARIDSRRTSDADSSAGGSLVALSDGTGVDPLFLVHAVGGTVVPYTPLALELADRYRVFGIQSPGLAGAALPESATLPGLAGRYLAELRKIQPAGPYRVGGWSMGGLLAYEIACQLEDAGEVVELLVLLDPPFAIAETGSTDRHLARRFVADALRTLNEPAGQAESADDPLACLMRVLDPGAAQDTLAEEVRRRLAAFSYHHRLMSGYRPARPVPAMATLLVSAEQSPNAAVQGDWVGLVSGNLRVASYDADHYSLLQLPHVRDVAACMAADPPT